LAFRGFFVRLTIHTLRRNRSALRFPWLSLPLALQRGSVSELSPQFQPSPCGASQPALPARNFDGAIFRQPPPLIQILRGPSNQVTLTGALAGRSKSPRLPCQPPSQWEPVYSRFFSGLPIPPASREDRLFEFQNLRLDI
jgi:hypothetical protein